MRQLYQKANLIHADLSEYNMLYHNYQIWFIDVSQAVETTHPNGRLFLLRDCFNVTKFFRSIGVESVLSELELFSFVAGDSFAGGSSEELMDEVRQFVHSKVGETAHLAKEDLYQHLELVIPSIMEDQLEDLEALSSDSEEEEEEEEGD